MSTLRAALLNVFPATVIAVGLALTSQFAAAQTATSPSDTGVQQPAQQPDAPVSASEAKTFTGKIVKDGDKFVLTDADGKMTYQLDNQHKAKSFFNKNVKVNGVLDNASGVIRVNTIEPAA